MRTTDRARNGLFQGLPLTAEEALIALAVGGSGGEPQLRDLLDGDLDWERVILQLERDRTQLAFWNRIVRVGPERLPSELRDRLYRLAQIAAFRQARLEERLGQVLEVLNTAQIDVLFLKGAALAVSVYRDFSERPMADLDLLILPDRAEQAQRLLLQAGWIRAAPISAVRQDALYGDHHHLAPLADDRGTGVIVELHTQPLPLHHPFRFSAADFWREARPVRFRGHTAYVPDFEQSALHLCMHYAWAHTAQRGAWRTFQDLQTLASRDLLDWDRLVTLARDTRGASCAYWTLRLCNRVMGTPVPTDVLQALTPPGAWRRTRFLEQHFLVSLLGRASCPSPRLERLLWEIAMAPGPSGHGDARPWLAQDRFAAAGVAVASPRGVPETSAWRDLTGWQRYMSALLSAPPALSSSR